MNQVAPATNVARVLGATPSRAQLTTHATLAEAQRSPLHVELVPLVVDVGVKADEGPDVMVLDD